MCFQADINQVPKRYLDWVDLPWWRIYTLNIDNLADALQESRPLLRDGLQILSARSSSTPGDVRDGVGRAFVHLNGRLPDFPDLTFW